MCLFKIVLARYGARCARGGTHCVRGGTRPDTSILALVLSRPFVGIVVVLATLAVNTDVVAPSRVPEVSRKQSRRKVGTHLREL